MKQVIILRKDLNLRKGKCVAQGGHAVAGAILGQSISMKSLSKSTKEIGLVLTGDMLEWIRTGMKKVCLGCDSLEQLMDLFQRAKAAGLPAYTVTDAGHTEVEPGTITCIGIGPAEDSRIDQITGQLKLL